MNTIRRLSIWLILLLSLSLLSGCMGFAREVVKSAALQPYHEAMREGRMLPSEYFRTEAEIDRNLKPYENFQARQ